MGDGRTTSNWRWKDMDARRRAGALGAAAVQLTLLGTALLDLRRRPAERVRGPKRLWYGLVFVNYLGPIAYFLVGRR